MKSTTIRGTAPTARQATPRRGTAKTAASATASPLPPFPGWILLNLHPAEADAWNRAAIAHGKLIREFGSEVLSRAAEAPLSKQPEMLTMPSIPGQPWPGDTRVVEFAPSVWESIVRTAGKLGVPPLDWAFSVIVAESKNYKNAPERLARTPRVQAMRDAKAGRTAAAEPTHAQLIRMGTPVVGRSVVAKFEVRTPWVKVALKVRAETAAYLQAKPRIIFESLGEGIHAACLPAWFEMNAGKRHNGGKIDWLKTRAEDWIRWVRGKRLAEIEVAMPERDWLMIQEIARRIDVPADAICRACLEERARQLRKLHGEPEA
jgi:hypothetical protein